MKKGIVLFMMMCAVGLKGQAQIYGYDQAIKLPTAELYDMNMMNAYANALRETAARRQQFYYYYSNTAMQMMTEKRWGSAIDYIDKALETGYYCGDIYFMRGKCYEELGDYKTAKSDYKRGKELGSEYAEEALEELKEKMKRK